MASSDHVRETVRDLGSPDVVAAGKADVGKVRSHRVRTRWWVVVGLAVLLVVYLFWCNLSGTVPFGFVHLSFPVWLADYLPALLLVVFLGAATILPLLLAGRSPHVLYRPSEIPVGFDDVVGMGNVREEVVRSLNLFLGYKSFKDSMGGTPRRALLFEGPPGTGKTYMAKAMAKEAGVPFLFVSASSFQSMYYGQTNRKIRSFFRELRKAARREGGAIGFIEEFDAIALSRSGMRSAMGQSPIDRVGDAGWDGGTGIERAGSPQEGGISGVVNELLVQLQSFDEPTAGSRLRGWFKDRVNGWMPSNLQFRKRPPTTANILVIGATNRAADLDPALLRPGRFDRTIHFDVPTRKGRAEILDYYLARKAHDAELDDPDRREALASMTMGYSPVMLEHLLDEALVWALRDGRPAMSWDDVQQAKLTEEVGLKEPVDYSPEERRIIATHEAGHAVVAYLAGKGRKLDFLTIVKRRGSLGLLAHSDTEERFTQTKSELLARIKIAFGGMVAEEEFFGESGTGPSSDLAYAPTVAAQMVGSLGMGGSLISFDSVSDTLTQSGIVAKVLSSDRTRHATEHILDHSKAETVELLRTHRHLVEALRDALLEREELVGEEIVEVLRDAEMDYLAEDVLH